jgi:hypothetical protein
VVLGIEPSSEGYSLRKAPYNLKKIPIPTDMQAETQKHNTYEKQSNMTLPKLSNSSITEFKDIEKVKMLDKKF